MDATRLSGILRRRPVVAAALALAAAVAAGAVVLGPDRIGRAVDFAADLNVTELSYCACRPDTTVSFTNENGLALAASVYEPARSPAAGTPGVVLVHGNTPRGRRLPLYRLLARRLAERGHVVLALDLGGFGESEDPFRRGAGGGYDFEADVRAGLGYLDRRAGVHPDSLFLLAHSLGASPALAVSLEDPRVRAAALVGPPRRNTERLRSPSQRAYFWDRAVSTHREVYGRGFPEWYGREQFVEEKRARDIERSLPDLAVEGHTPVLLLDGAREPAADRRYLAEYHRRMACPKAYHTLEDAGHYLNTIELVGPLDGFLFDAEVARRAVEHIDGWFRGGWKDCSGERREEKNVSGTADTA